MARSLMAFSLVVLMMPASAARDWAPLEPKDLVGSVDYALRKDKPHFYLRAFGDFTGNGRLDLVMMIRRQKGDFAVVVHLRAPNGGRKKYVLYHTDNKNLFERHGVAAVPPGRYETACAKRYGVSCASTELQQLDLKTAAINLFMFESASLYYVWTGEGFEQITISD